MTDMPTANPAPISSALEGVALAQTFDDATLRRVFPDAPADAAVARDVDSLFKHRMRTIGGANHTVLLLGWVLALVVGLAVGVTAGLVGWIITGLAVAAAIVTLFMQYGRASDDFFDAYARARGLSFLEDSEIGAGIPLFGRGDKRKWPVVLRGTIAGQPAELGHYTYTTVTRDSDGNREETDHDYTVLRFTLPPAVAARFAGVYCSPRSISFGALQDKLARDRKVELESIEFGKRYSLRVVDSQDDIALYELFSPPFIQSLSTELEAYWEQQGADLVFWKRNHETEAADFDRFCLESWHVLQRYLEEWQ